MKKLAFSLILTVFSFTAFAANDANSRQKNLKNQLIGSSSKTESTDQIQTCISVTFSCGATSVICDYTGTFEGLMRLVRLGEVVYCGGGVVR